MLRSLAVAISTYSKIPVPHFNWEEKDMEYSMVFFPVVGVFIGAFQYLLFLLCDHFSVGKILFAVLATILPLLITGGIHFDGYLDVCDARSSYASKEKKLEILKDPHVGAFAIIHGIIYVLLTFGLWTEVIEKAENNKTYFLLIGVSYVISRILSAISVVTFKKAKSQGMVSSMAKAQNKKVNVILILEFVIVLGLLAFFFQLLAFAIVIPFALVFLYYRLMSYKVFGGITGDLAGWFLQMAELMGLAGVFIWFLL